MGGVLCCIRKPREDGDVSSSSPKASDRSRRKYREPANSSEWKTLEDYFLNSPANTPCIMGGDLQGQKFSNLHKKVYPSSSPDDADTSQEFFTPRRSFISTERLAKIEEDDAKKMNSASTTPSSSGKLRKTVTFRLPEEADIFVYYSPRQTFEEAY